RSGAEPMRNQASDPAATAPAAAAITCAIQPGLPTVALSACACGAGADLREAVAACDGEAALMESDFATLSLRAATTVADIGAAGSFGAASSALVLSADALLCGAFADPVAVVLALAARSSSLTSDCEATATG